MLFTTELLPLDAVRKADKERKGMAIKKGSSWHSGPKRNHLRLYKEPTSVAEVLGDDLFPPFQRFSVSQFLFLEILKGPSNKEVQMQNTFK